MFKGSPIYLEWVPSNFINEKEKKPKVENIEVAIEEDKNLKTVFMKNLNFETTEQDIENELVSKNIQAPKCVKIVRKNNKSMGFGFVEFHNREDAEKLIKNL